MSLWSIFPAECTKKEYARIRKGGAGVRSSGGEESDSSRRNPDRTRRANPKGELAFVGRRWSSPNLPADFSQHYGRLVQAVHDAQQGTLTPGERRALALLIRALRKLLDTERVAD
jgi:hypothetical protein